MAALDLEPDMVFSTFLAAFLTNKAAITVTKVRNSVHEFSFEQWQNVCRTDLDL